LKDVGGGRAPNGHRHAREGKGLRHCYDQRGVAWRNLGGAGARFGDGGVEEKCGNGCEHGGFQEVERATA
jgi:hypothetical protein